MTSQGGYVEQKTIGISIGTSGTFINTEIVDGKIQLVKKSVNPDIYATNGEWISSVVNIGDNFESYGKLLVKEVGNNNSYISVFTRTSSDGINFNEWTKISEENDILSVKNKFIMVKLELLAGFEADLMTVLPGEDMVNGQYIVEDVSGNIKLNRNYTDDMTSDNTWSENGSLHRRLITRSDWLRLDKLSIPPTVGQIDKTLILLNNEYKKWNEMIVEYSNAYTPLSSNTTPSPYVASASDFFSPTTNTYNAYKAFDGDVTTCWLSLNETSTGYLSIKLAESKLLSAYEIISDNGSQIPKSWKLLGSDDGITWNILDTRSNLTLLVGESNIFEITPTKGYLYYKIEVSATNTANRRVRINSLNLYEDTNVIPATWSTVSSTLPTQEQFLSEGVDSLSPLLDRRVEELEPLPMTEDSTQTENGKLFSKTLSLNKYIDIRNIKVDVK